MGKEYLITEEQLNKIDHYKRMFEINADLVKDLCSTEQHDIVYGFGLGQIHSNLRDCFMGMMELESEVANQKVVE
jgi:hypothetical protein